MRINAFTPHDSTMMLPAVAPVQLLSNPMATTLEIVAVKSPFPNIRPKTVAQALLLVCTLLNRQFIAECSCSPSEYKKMVFNISTHNLLMILIEWGNSHNVLEFSNMS